MEHVDAVGDRPQIVEGPVLDRQDVARVGGDVDDEPRIEDELSGLLGQSPPVGEVEQVLVSEERDKDDLKGPAGEDRSCSTNFFPMPGPKILK